MAEELQAAEPNLEGLQQDLNNSFNTLDFDSPIATSTDLPAKPEAIDIYKQNVGNPITGSNPVSKTTGYNTLDFADTLAADSYKKSVTSGEDPYIKMRPFTYNGDYDGANFNRYYGTEAYKTLGFTPYRDNDALYNQKMTFGDQFVRAAGQWDNLLATGFMSGVKSWGTLFTDPVAPDLESAKEFKRAMAIGSDTSGGIGGFVTNNFLNSAYSIGIGLEFLAEEAALAAGTAFTGGLAGEVTLPAMAAKAGFFGRQLAKIGEAGAKIAGKTDRFAISAEKAAGFATRAEEAASKTSGGKDIKSAIDFFGKAASGVLDVVNPFEKTAEALKSTRYATDLAKTVGTAGAFADDIIRIKTAASEAQLEGGMVMIDATEKLIDQYRDMNNGKDPEGEDLKNIHNLASAEARRTTLYNFPAILTTNKLLFSTILYPLNKSVGNTTGRLLKEVVTGDIKAGTQNLFSQLEKGASARIKAAAKSFAKPSIYGAYGMNYLKANIGEGLQENIQEAISNGAIEHALAVQKDPATAAYRGYMGYLMDGFKNQLNAQGAETFASGFLMGMFTQPIMTAPAWAISKGIDKITNREDLKAIKDQRDAAIKSQVDALNDMANNDINYWAPDLATAVKNGKLSNDLTSAAAMGDEKTARDAKFRIEFNHIATAVQSGKFEDLMTKLADYKNLSPQQALEAFGRYGIGINTEEDAGKALQHIDGVIERARSIKDKYEKVAQDFPNPFNPSGLKPGSKERQAMVESYHAWEEAQKNLVFATSEFENYSQRLGSMTDAFSSLASNIAGADTQSLLSTMSMTGMAREIVTLKQEIETLGEVEAQASVKKQKEKTLKLLEKFYEDIDEAQSKINSENITDYHEKQLLYLDAKESYKKYLNHIAKTNDNIVFDSTTDKAFGLLTDTLEMKGERERLARSINVLSNPKGFLLLQKRLQDAFGVEISEKELRMAENVKSFLTMQDENNVIEALGKKGVKISDEFIKEYKEALNNKKPLPVPPSFFDPATQQEITQESNPEKYAEALEAWQGFKAWMELTNDIEELAAPVEETEEDKKAVEDYNAYDQELKGTLESLYNNAKETGEIAKDYPFSKYLTSTDAQTAVAMHKLNKNNEKYAQEALEKEKKEKEGIPLGTKVNPEARANLNIMGYTNTQIDALSREEREKILKGGILPEDYYKAPLSDIEAKKAEIERRRQASLRHITQSSLNFDADRGYVGKYNLPNSEIIDSNGKPSGIYRDTEIVRGDTKEEVEKEINSKYDAELDALEEPVKKEPVVTEEPTENIHPEYKGKIVWATPGSGKTEIVKDNKDVVDADLLLLETFEELYPGTKLINESRTARQNIFDITKYGPQEVNLDKKKWYDITRQKLKAMAAKGKVVLTGSREFMKDADFIMIQKNDELLLKDYDNDRDIFMAAELSTPMVAITEYISEAIKKSPLEQIKAGQTLVDLEKAKAAQEQLKTNLTIEDINNNLTPSNLAVAQERGYDAIYKNNRYAITKVDENSVSLKALDGSTMTVKPEEISGVTQQEDVVDKPEDTKTFKNNDEVLGEEDINIDFDADNLNDAAGNITNNIC